MAPLAAIVAERGGRVYGSDRAFDQGKSPEKFRALQDAGIWLFPQDGSGVDARADVLVVSSAIEESIPDVGAALSRGIPIQKRAELLAELFNESPCGISIAGTSGKSTVTGMVSVMLSAMDIDPTVMNGGVIVNFKDAPEPGQIIPSMRVGGGGVFVTETDESDGSIELYRPSVAVVNNVALDHKPVAELLGLFGDFIARAEKAVVLNFDDPHLRELAQKAKVPVYSYSLGVQEAALRAYDLEYLPSGVRFRVERERRSYPVCLQVPGGHNVANALAALSVGLAMGLDLDKLIPALETFKGISRRLEVTGGRGGITVIDDFAHNPDKIAASLKTLKEFDGRLFVIFQPHGFGPLKLMGREIVESFARYLGAEDQLLMPEVYYAGGTADRSVTARHVIGWAQEAGVDAHCFDVRGDIIPYIKAHAKTGNRIVVMGARDDTLSDFACEILELF